MGAAEDRELVSELEKLVEAIDTFTLGILAESLTLADQRAFEERLLDVAVHIHKRADRPAARVDLAEDPVLGNSGCGGGE